MINNIVNLPWDNADGGTDGPSTFRAACSSDFISLWSPSEEATSGTPSLEAHSSA